jgi:peptidoglycan/LPS O-acetylase OafA/YrhL
VIAGGSVLTPTYALPAADRPSPPRRHRLEGLDAMRGVAVLMVLGAHFNLTAPLSTAPWLNGVLLHWQASGWSGVDLFFVLSGFLISSLLFREHAAHGRVRVGRFLLRRGLKIYPSFWVMVLFTVCAMLATGHPVQPAELLSELLFVQNYGPSLYNYTWSLAVEEHFYLLLVGLIVWLGTRDHDVRGVLRVALFTLPAVLVARFVSVWVWPEWYRIHVSYTHLRLDGLAFGVALGYVAVFHGDALEHWVRQWRWVLLIASGLLCVSLAGVPQRSPWLFTVGLSTLYLGAGSLLLLARYSPFALGLSGLVAPLAWVGANSYAIYLWHVPVRQWGGGLLAWLTGQEAPTVGGLLLYVLGAVLFGAFMTRMVERPALAWRDRYVP